jgi:hypothetical protein
MGGTYYRGMCGPRAEVRGDITTPEDFALAFYDPYDEEAEGSIKFIYACLESQYFQVDLGLNDLRSVQELKCSHGAKCVPLKTPKINDIEQAIHFGGC